jgi:anoctamin-8
LQGLRATPADVQVLQGRASVAEGQSIVAAWQESGLIIQVFPLHETNALTKLQTSWVRKLLAPQPLGEHSFMPHGVFIIIFVFQMILPHILV